LYRFALAANESLTNRETLMAYDEARALFEADGDMRGAARTMLAMRDPLTAVGDARWREYVDRALDLLVPAEPSVDLVNALTEKALAGLWSFDAPEALRYAQRALEVAGSLGLRPPTQALTLRGQAKIMLGDERDGFVDLEEAFQAAMAAGRYADAVETSEFRAGLALSHQGPDAAAKAHLAALEIAVAHGLTSWTVTVRAGYADDIFRLGRMDEAQSELDKLDAELKAGDDRWTERNALDTRAAIALARGDLVRIRRLLPTMLDLSGPLSSDDFAPGRATTATACLAVGDEEEAARIVALVLTGRRESSRYYRSVAEITRVAVALRDVGSARDVPRGVGTQNALQRNGLVSNEALVAEADERWTDAVAAHEQAAAAWAAFGIPLEAAHSLLGAARCLAALGVQDQATGHAVEARGTAERIGATALVQKADVLLRQPTTALPNARPRGSKD
jgi:hypothetical protein